MELKTLLIEFDGFGVLSLGVEAFRQIATLLCLVLIRNVHVLVNIYST